MTYIARLIVLIALFFCVELAAKDKFIDNSALTQPIVIAMGEDTFPFQYIDENGQASGILVDLWLEWSSITGIPIVLRPQNWERSLSQVKSHQADVHIGMVHNDERAKLFDFANPITSLNTYLFIHKSISRKQQLTDLLPYQIGIVSGSSHELELLSIDQGFSFKKYPNREALLDGASNGEVLVFAGIEGYQRNLTLEKDIANDYYSSSRLPIKKIALAPAVVKGNSELLNKINAGFEKISSDILQKIERRWLGYHRENAGVMIAMQTGVEPYVDIGVDGQPHGLFVDLWQLWSKKTGISVDFVVGDMNSSVEDIKRGFADVHIGYPESNEMRTGLKQAWHLTSVKSRFFSMGVHIDSIAKLDKPKVGVFPTAPYISEILNLYPNAQLKFYESTMDLVNATQKGEIVGFFASSAMTSHYLLASKLWSEFQQFSQVEFSTDIYSLTRIDDNGLIERIQSGFQLISPEERLQLERKWLINPDDRYFSQQQNNIILSNIERSYLASLGAIKMGYLEDWAPMEFKGNNGEFLGVNADIKSLLANQLGLSIIPVAFNTFDEMLKQLESGEIQLVASLAYNQDREKTITFSEPYWPAPWAVASGLSQPPLFNVSQLSGKRIAVIDGYQMVDLIRLQYPDIELVLVRDTADGLDTVVSGSADMFIDKVAALAATLKDGSYPSLKLSLLADLADNHSRIGVYADLIELVPLINRVLSTVDKSGQQAIYQKWNEVELSSTSVLYQRWFVWLLFVLIGVSAIAIIVIVVNRRLNREIMMRQDAEDKLVYIANHDHVTGLVNRGLLEQKLVEAIKSHQQNLSMFAILFVDLDGFKVVNDRFGHDVGDKLLETVGSCLHKTIRQTDIAARYGGDEFVIILNQIDSRETTNRVKNEIISAIENLTKIEEHPIHISASVGVAHFPDNGRTAEQLLKHADELMYEEKRLAKTQSNVGFLSN